MMVKLIDFYHKQANKNLVKTHLYFLFCLLLAVGCTSNSDEKIFEDQQNAVWAESIYLRGFQPTTREKISEEKIEAFTSNLKSHHIKYVFLFAGPFGSDGHLPSYGFSKQAQQTVGRIQKLYPALKVLPWVGGIQNKTVYLEDSTWVKNAIADTKKLVKTLNVPGVHVDLEYILPGDSYLDKSMGKPKKEDYKIYGLNVNEFHRLLRIELPKAFISSVVVATSPDTRPWKRKTSLYELKDLIKYIDQLNFLYYDTQIHDQGVFDENCKKLLEDILILKKASKIQYLISIGSFMNTPELQKYRDFKIETIPNSLMTITSNAKKLMPLVKVIDGISIFCEWEMDEVKWAQFERYWGKYDEF